MSFRGPKRGSSEVLGLCLWIPQPLSYPTFQAYVSLFSLSLPPVFEQQLYCSPAGNPVYTPKLWLRWRTVLFYVHLAACRVVAVVFHVYINASWFFCSYSFLSGGMQLLLSANSKVCRITITQLHFPEPQIEWQVSATAKGNIFQSGFFWHDQSLSK